VLIDDLTHDGKADPASADAARDVGSACESVEDAQTIRFGYDSATNLTSTRTGHMHAMELTIDSPDKIHATWTYFQDGVFGHEAKFEMTRKGGKVSYSDRYFLGGDQTLRGFEFTPEGTVLVGSEVVHYTATTFGPF